MRGEGCVVKTEQDDHLSGTSCAWWSLGGKAFDCWLAQDRGGGRQRWKIGVCARQVVEPWVGADSTQKYPGGAGIVAVFCW